MSGARGLQGPDIARAEAEQAAFNEKKWVWVPDDKEGYAKGWVNSEHDGWAEIVMETPGDIRRMPLSALFRMNPPNFDRVEDIADLTILNEATVVHNLRLRYGSGDIYTYSSLFLVAINPYQDLKIYSDAIIQQYRSKRRNENPPHIFAVAERAWVNMGTERENQSILITGESGAGKTESTKKVIQYLAAIASDVHDRASHSRSPTATMSPAYTGTMPMSGLPRSTSIRRGHVTSTSTGNYSQSLTAKGRLGLLERQILQANPILEAFGNAQTQRNNNSSRFGKFIRISFAPDGSIAGANVDWYLLEKSRVCVRNDAERSFHVFYQLLSAADFDLRKELLLQGGIEDYEFLNKSRREVDGIDDRVEWNSLLMALETVGFSPQEQFDLFRIVAAVLHIGNIVITSSRGDDAVMADPSQAERVCHLLGISPAHFTEAILRPRALAGREWVTQTRTKQQSLDELAALSKTLYEKSFGAIVERINKALDRPSPKSTFIGVLDIAGFEIFEINSYEQLLINFTNEKLQQFFNHHMFVLEQEEYKREGIKWNYVNFGLDLQPTIDLIEVNSGNTIGILSTLDEECIMPKATDLTFTNKLNAMWGPQIVPASVDELESHAGRTKYAPTRFEQGFIVQHYAANVEYHTTGWLEKNKDPLNDNLARVLADSSDDYVASLFADYRDGPTAGGTYGIAAAKKRVVKKGAFRTVGQRHKEQLASLMSQLQATQPHFVRCIVPNSLKKGGRIDVPLVLDQLRCNGVLEGIRIAHLGYPNRLPFLEFRQRYEILAPGVVPRGYMDGREACARIVSALEEPLDLNDSKYKIGTSKIFFKAGVLAVLEEKRDVVLFELFTRIEAASRMWVARRQMKKVLNRAGAIRTVQRNARVYNELRDWAWWRLYTKVRPLLAATRNDEELRRKEQELLFATERAEREMREKENLENLKMSLEAEKRKVEEALDAERSLAMDKDSLLERSKKREQELEDELEALQSDLDTADSQIDRLTKHQRENEVKHERMTAMFSEATEHLVRFEQEQQAWVAKEAELTERLRAVQDQLDAVNAVVEEQRKTANHFKSLAEERGEDLVRAKERMEVNVKELEGKLVVEQSNGTMAKEKVDTLESEARQAAIQLDEMVRTANDYAAMLQKREERIAELEEEAEHSSVEQTLAGKEISELKSDVDTLMAELKEEKGARVKGDGVRMTLQAELDELRSHLEAKSSEEIRRKEVDKSREEELAKLRLQVTQVQAELTEVRRTALDAQSKLKLDLDNSTREHDNLRTAHALLVEKERSSHSELMELQKSIPDLERSKRTLESELRESRERQAETSDRLHEAEKAKENLERQLALSQAKSRDIDDVLVELQREKSNQHRQISELRKDLEAEQAKRTDLERRFTSQKAELARVKDLNTKTDRELNKILTDLKNKEWEVKQLESRQDKTIVEHVHVLEEAKRVTDGQLKDAQEELQRNALYIRSLEKSRLRLPGEVDDFGRPSDGERGSLRNISPTKTREDQANLEKERKARENSEATVRRLEQQLKSALDNLKTSDGRVKELERTLSNEGREASEMELAQRSLLAQLQDEREQHQKDLAERDFAADQTRKKYQGELGQLTEELQAQMDTVRKIREENRTLRDAHERLQFQFDDEVLNSGGWKNEKERLENKIRNMQKAYESALGGQSEQQAQIVALHSEVRKLRTVLDDVDAERNLLQKARRTLQSQLEDISQHHLDASQKTSEKDFQTLQLKKLDLERKVEEQAEHVNNAVKRMQTAESHANESQIQLGKLRVEYSELDRQNATLEKQLKELNVKIIDLETKHFANSSRANTLGRRIIQDGRVEELASQFGSSPKGDSPLRSPRDSVKFENAELARAKSKLDEERRIFQQQIGSIRTQMDDMQTQENKLQSEKRRAEREASEYKKRSLDLERELEVLKSRLEHPSGSLRRR